METDKTAVKQWGTRSKAEQTRPHRLIISTPAAKGAALDNLLIVLGSGKDVINGGL